VGNPKPETIPILEAGGVGIKSRWGIHTKSRRRLKKSEQLQSAFRGFDGFDGFDQFPTSLVNWDQ